MQTERTNDITNAGQSRRALSCACCGGDAGYWKQWSNQDRGWGLCRLCADHLTDDSDGAPRYSHAELRNTYGVPGVHFQPLTVLHMGRRFVVLADFPDTDAGEQLANDYMTEYPGAAVLCVQAGRVSLAEVADKGVKK